MKRFQALGMRAIDSPYKIIPRNMILRQKLKFVRFSLHTFISLNQGQGSILKIRECVQSILRMKLPPRNMILREKFEKFSIFASIHTFISLNQSQGSIFTLRECAQSIFRMILPLYRLFWQKNFFQRISHNCYPLE